MKYTRYLYLGVIFAAAATAQDRSSYMPPAATVTESAPALAGSQPDEAVLTIKKRVDEVHVLFIATDKHGKFVRNLNEGDFAFLDDNKPPQSINNFLRETDLPLQLGLLVDTSGSVRGRFDFEQEAAISFLQHTLRTNFDKALIMGFSGHSRVAQDFTDNVSLLSTGVNSLRSGGGTALYDAVYKVCHDKFLKSKDSDERPTRRAIIVVSDGEDNQSEVSKAQAIEMAERAEVIIYAISTDDSGLILRGDKALQELADATGGRAFFPYKMKDIKNSFSAIETELRSQYVVSYLPADFDADGRYRSIAITALKKDLQVRARRGYFAPRQ